MLLSITGVASALIAIGAATALLWFGWHLVFRRVYRARHLRQLEMDRLIREAASRDMEDDTKR